MELLYCLWAAFASSTLCGVGAHAGSVAVQDTFSVKLKHQVFSLYNSNGQVHHKSIYYGTLSVGGPKGQPFTAVFDSGSSHLVLPSSTCRSTSCGTHHKYQAELSEFSTDIDADGSNIGEKAVRDQITVSFGTGEITGVYVEDLVCLGPPRLDDNETQPEEGTALFQSTWVKRNVAKVSEEENTTISEEEESTAVAKTNPAKEQAGCQMLRFISASRMSDDPFADFSFDAVLGLGLEGLSTSDEFNFIKMMSQSQWPSQPGLEGAFSVFLAPVDGVEDSEVTFGGVNYEHIVEGDEMKWCGVLDSEIGYWQIPISTISVDGVALDYCNDGTCRAIVDTGTSLISVPRTLGLELRAKLAHEGVDEDQKCHGPGPRLEFTLCGFTMTLDPKNYARPKVVRNNKTDSVPARRNNKTDSVPAATEVAISAGTMNETSSNSVPTTDNRCVAMLMFMSLPPPLSPKTVVFGEPIMQKYYTAFDAKQKRVGFTEARFRGRLSEVVTV
jgi:hypothetical protein